MEDVVGVGSVDEWSPNVVSLAGRIVVFVYAIYGVDSDCHHCSVS
jgi:hypothetical protein